MFLEVISEKKGQPLIIWNLDSLTCKNEIEKLFLRLATLYRDTQSLLGAVAKMKYKGGNTATGKALTFALDQVFGRSSRPNAQKVVLVITDGESLQDTVTEPARRLRENGVEIFSIGVGDEINLLELQVIFLIN